MAKEGSVDDYKFDLPCGEVCMPGIRWNGSYWEEYDGEPDVSHIEAKPEQNLTCTCGVDSIGYGKHSDWCDKGEENV